MLVLQRYINGQIIIITEKGPITITLVEVDHRRSARIGIDAPKEYKIWRKELIDENRNESGEANS